MPETTNSQPVNRLLSEDYMDLIVSIRNEQNFYENTQETQGKVLSPQYGLIHVPISLFGEYLLEYTAYYTIPKLYTTLDTTSLEVSGILQLQNQPILNLKGDNVLIGFIDTGIDYTNRAFRKSDGSSRILGIWDQTDQSGTSPTNFSYGSQYLQSEITYALNQANPYDYVPVTDPSGHGTRMAAIAAGSQDAENDFIGAAPRADIAVVKLKKAKEFLIDYFQTASNPDTFQESDIIFGINYLLQISRIYRKPLVVCLGIGTNQGDHAGNSPLAQIIDGYGAVTGFCTVVAAGNEAGMAHHFYSKLENSQAVDNIQLLVSEKDTGFSMQLWTQAPQLLSVAFTTPRGESVPRLPARLRQYETYTFLLETTRLTVEYEIVEVQSGSQLILIRFRNPTPGIWTITINSEIYMDGVYHIWLPVTGLISPDTVFLQPNPDTTLTDPASASSVITTSTYNAYDNSLFINSSRGYTRTGALKPDLAAPGVNVYGPNSSGGYTSNTGSSIAAAITAGSVALLYNWGMTRAVPHVLSSSEIKTYLIRGARRVDSNLYPNREWGYGALDLYGIFTSLQ